jgi:hypothetical protein
VRATGRRRYQLIHKTRLFLLTAVGVLALPVAAARADASWTGASSSSNWSDSANWADATPPTGSTGTLTFPSLGSCGTCYTSNNNLGGVSATSLVLSNASSQYQIKGNTFTVGSGGINDTPGHGTGDVITARIALSDSQTWVVGTTVNNGYNSLTLLGGVTGPTSAAVTMSTPDGDLFVDSDMEAGPVTSQGPGGLHIGGAPGLNEPGSINGSNGQPVTVNGGNLIPNPSSTTGPLTINGKTLLLLGTNKANTDATTLQVNGDAMLGSSITTRTYIDNNGSTAGTDFSQLRANGNIILGGTLDLRQARLNNNTGTCVALTPGDVATLVTTTGTLSGTFANAPDGATLTMTSSCQTTAPQVQINYTANSVTATVLGAATPTTTTLATPNPSPASTNQPVTLTATVATSGGGAPVTDGTVAFSANGSVISGCDSQSLSPSGTATCTTSFAANSSPESLKAAFTPANGSGLAASTSSARSLTVNRASTTTAVVPSNTEPIVGTSVTYTATVTPANTGPAQPTGAIEFLDDGGPIAGCTAQPLLAGSQATCTVVYPATGSHTIAASYGADANFTGSTSPPATVTVVATPTTTALATPSPSPASTNQAVTLTATVTTNGTGTLAPAGTVAFSGNAGTISGCASQPLTVSGSSGTATCSTSFPAAGSPQSLTATFNPSSGSDQAASISSTQSLTVNPAATTADLQASSTSPPAGTSVTYTATVTPAATGASLPSGTIAFLDGEGPIPGCTAEPLTAGSSSSTATCTVPYTSGGAHTVTAGYAGDPNFSGSTSPEAMVTVQPSTTPSGGGSGGPTPGIGSGTPRAGLTLSQVAQTRTRWRELHARRTAAGLRQEPVGTRFTFTVSGAARVTFTFIQTLPGRRVGGRCVAPSTDTKRARACQRTRTRGRLVQSVAAGTHHLSFNGHLGHTTLPVGTYTLTLTAVTSDHTRSRTLTLHFTIVG